MKNLLKSRKKPKLSSLVLILFSLCLVGLSGWMYSTADSGGMVGVHVVDHDPMWFDQGIRGLDKNISNDPVVAGVVPHHLVASDMVVEFFYRLSLQNPEVLILITPNHFEAGDGDFLSTDWDFETEFGVVEIDRQGLASLVETGIVAVDNDVISQEHAITGLVPYIEYFMPEVRLVPIAVSNYTDQETIYMLVESLKSMIGNESVVVGSVDFSHYLNSEEADKHDDVTLRLVQDRSVDDVLKLNNDFVDSPVALSVLMLMAGDRDLDVWGHDNSGRRSGNEWIETTSYFIWGWMRQTD